MGIAYRWIAVGVLVLDYVTKWAVQSNMFLGESIELIPGYLRLSHVRNTGVAFGLFDGSRSALKPYLLSALAIVAVVVIMIYGARVPRHRILLQSALAVIMGGILGNFVDRAAHGFVVDFVEFHVRDSFYWPTFNAADSAITVGIAMLLMDTVKNPEPAAQPGNA